MPVAARRALRKTLWDGLKAGSALQTVWQAALLPQNAVELGLPCEVGDYTDFYTGIHHATTVGKLFRPDNPLLPNYKWVPIGYHGRASSIGASGHSVRRPCGQTLKPGAEIPALTATQRLDYELELAIWVGQGNALGEPVPLDERRRPCVGREPAQRLERARLSGLGIPAAGAVPGQKLCHHHITLGGVAGCVGAISRAVYAARG